MTLPAIDHAEAATLLHAAFDGELDAVTQMRVEAHLADCPACAPDYARLSALRTAIRTNATRHNAPDTVRAALLQSLTPPPAPNIVPLRRRWLRPAASGFALGAALAASVAVLIDTRNDRDALSDSIVAAHIRGMQPGHLTDIQVSDRHQVKPWFDGKLDFTPPVKELGAQGFDLVGGRLDYIGGREAAVIVYRRKLHVIDLFVTEGGGPVAGPSEGAHNGYHVEYWRDGGQNYWAVSDIGKSELSDFADAWKRQ